MILEPYLGIQGPLPRIVPLLASALRAAGYEVATERWGRHRDHESTLDKVGGRLGDTRRIWARLSGERFDVLFAPTSHDWHTLSRDIPLLLAARSRCRTLIQIHGSRFEDLHGAGHTFFKLASRILFRLSDAVIVSSQTESDALAKFSPATPFLVADNIYDPPPPSPPSALPVEWRLPADRPVLLFASRLIPEKGILDLLDALPQVLAQVACHLLLAGVGPLEGEVRKRIAPLSEHVSWVRYLGRPQLEQAYRTAAVFVLPSYHVEGFPAVIQDALGHGIPIVTTPIRGLKDHLKDGVNALLVPPRDQQALARALVRLLKDAGLRAAMSEANRRKAQEFHSSVVVKQYENALQRVLNARG